MMVSAPAGKVAVETPAPAEPRVGTAAERSLDVTVAALGLVVLASAALIGLVDPADTRFLAWTLLGFVVAASLVRPFPAAGPLGTLLAVAGLSGAHLALTIGAAESTGSAFLARAAAEAGALVAAGSLAAVVARQLERVRDGISLQAQTLRALVAHDETTGLLKEEHLLRRLADEVERARRYAYPVTLLLLAGALPPSAAPEPGSDLGSLKRLVEDVQSIIRRQDSLGHYGEGLLLMLPHTVLEGALAAASKLVDRLAGEAGQAICVGVAEFPDDAATVEDLLNEAQQAAAFARAAGVSVASRSLLS